MGRLLCVVVLLQMGGLAAGEGFDGFLRRGEERLFPIGFYDMPEDEAGLREIAGAGVNLVHCRRVEELDRAQAAGMQGVVPLPLDKGATAALREQVGKLAGHPALAVWEGPDEVVWNFTAFSGLYRTLGIHKESGAWWKQTPEAVAYAEQRAAEIMPNMRAAVAMIREMDGGAHPVWINEAEKSDVGYVRQYLEFVDVTGCDIYPIKAEKRNPARVGSSVERWIEAGNGKPVWMVLQAFSWNELGEYYGAKETAYPTFAESRLMAYDAIAHGARGILYWGGRFAKSGEFRQSLYALTAELAALQPFLTAADVPGVGVRLVEMPEDGGGKRVACTVRNSDEDWLIVLVNEDDEAHMGVVVAGLGQLEGRTLHELYGETAVTVSNGEVVTRMMPRTVQVLCTSKAYEARRNGRAFGD
ncbi:MAG TPA: hypothetical protein VMZ06_11015 [Candidatus Bathyarchaeia archaeon]|nr:hypothetical protein [Candidatus Bathyarchaeia archaeon]